MDTTHLNSTMDMHAWHTKNILAHLARDVEGYIPEDLWQELQDRVEHIERHPDISATEIEEHVIAGGKKVWPYRKAFQDYNDVAENQLGEHYFVSALPQHLHRPYRQAVERGSDWQDWHRGKDVHEHLTPDQRRDITEAIVAMRQALRVHVVQHIKGVGQDGFWNKVGEYQAVLEAIEAELHALNALAEAEGHEQLAAEIRAYVQGVEYGFGLLGKEVRPQDIFRAKEHFLGRKTELLWSCK